jgi:uncharacterized MAPEG superfamily protein
MAIRGFMGGDSTVKDLDGVDRRYICDAVKTPDYRRSFPMVILVLLVLALFVMQTLLPGRFREPAPDGAKGKLAENLGNRDHVRPLTVVGQRASRALDNMHEALPVFLALALLNMIVGTAAGMAITGATVFLIARMVYVAVYMSGVAVVRTLVWVVSWVGLAMMVVPLLDRV